MMKEGFGNLDRAMLSILDTYEVVSVSASVIRGEDVVWCNSYGWQDREEKKAMDGDRVMRVASISKSFTALAIMELMDRGLIDLEEDCNKYIQSQVEIRHPAFPQEPITPWQLLNHTSGVLNGLYAEFCQAGITAVREQKPIPTLEEYFQPGGDFYSDRHWGPHKPGEDFSYSNMGYVLLGAIIEGISGKPFDVFMREHILQPLGMDNAGFNVRDIPASLLCPMYRRTGDPPSYSKEVPGPVPHASKYVPGTHGGLYGPQGGLFISLKELMHFPMAMMAGGEVSGKRILPSGLVEMMHRVSVETSKKGPETFYGLYTKKGLGIHITDDVLPGHTLYGHPGQAYGINTGMHYTMDQGEDNFALLYFINGCNTEIPGKRSPLHRIEEDIIDLLYRELIRPPHKDLERR